MLPIFDWYSVMDIVHATYSYTFTGTKLARPWSIGSSHIHVCNNHCRARFLRAINSSSPHSWVPLSLSPSECNVVAMQRDRSTPCGECGRAWFEKRQGKKLQSFGLFLPKGTWLHVLDPSHDLSRLHLFFCIYLSFVAVLICTKHSSPACTWSLIHYWAKSETWISLRGQ